MSFVSPGITFICSSNNPSHFMNSKIGRKPQKTNYIFKMDWAFSSKRLGFNNTLNYLFIYFFIYTFCGWNKCLFLMRKEKVLKLCHYKLTFSFKRPKKDWNIKRPFKYKKKRFRYVFSCLFLLWNRTTLIYVLILLFIFWINGENSLKIKLAFIL